MMPFKRELIKRVLKEQHEPVLENHTQLKTPFDQLFLRYLGAIHINEAINVNDHLLIGKLWLHLYWLFVDAEDADMQKYCAERAADLLAKALEAHAISDNYAIQRYQLTTANLYAENGDKQSAVKWCDEAASGEDGTLKKFALTLKNGLQ